MLSTLCNRISCNSSRPQERLGQVECALWKLAGQIFYNDMANENICTTNGDKKYFLGFLELKFHIWVNPPWGFCQEILHFKAIFRGNICPSIFFKFSTRKNLFLNWAKPEFYFCKYLFDSRIVQWCMQSRWSPPSSGSDQDQARTCDSLLQGPSHFLSTSMTFAWECKVHSASSQLTRSPAAPHSSSPALVKFSILSTDKEELNTFMSDTLPVYSSIV